MEGGLSQIRSQIIDHMDTLATIYDKMHVIECSGATLLLGAQPPDLLLQRYSQLPPLSQQVQHLPVVTARS